MNFRWPKIAKILMIILVLIVYIILFLKQVNKLESMLKEKELKLKLEFALLTRKLKMETITQK